MKSFLLDLCQRGDWTAVIARCSSHPHEAEPYLLQPQPWSTSHSYRREHCDVPSNECFTVGIYGVTPLGFVVRSTISDSSLLEKLVENLLLACPTQVLADQFLPGHTPLRDAILNPCCSPRVLQMLLHADQTYKSTLTRADRSGFVPADHIIMNLHVYRSSISLEKFHVFFDSFQDLSPTTQRLNRASSAIVKLLTIGSYSSNANKRRALGRPIRLEYTENAIKMLLAKFPSSAFETSAMTGCSVLHLALRNFGSVTSLVEKILDVADDRRLLSQQNKKGQSVFHVACSEGVEMDTLLLLLRRAVSMVGESKGATTSPNPFIWTATQCGETPLDLELSRVLLGKRKNSSLLTGTTEFENILADTFKDIVLEEDNEKKPAQTIQSRKALAESRFGGALDRISCIISAAASNDISVWSPTLQHDLCKLITPFGPSLCRHMIDLFMWVYEEKMNLKDEDGNLPIHYALMCDPGSISSTSESIPWQLSVQKLLALPESARIKTRSGQLPIHLLLSIKQAEGGGEKNMDEAFDSLLRMAVDLYPESVDLQDPPTGLQPFMLAATHNWSINSIYHLIRRSPSISVPVYVDCDPQIKAARQVLASSLGYSQFTSPNLKLV